ncbi:diamine N-acetyltransferase [Burkholderiales bacterium]|nr:diamine N-acetyltransferase [Burkholderiales bacterium]
MFASPQADSITIRRAAQDDLPALVGIDPLAQSNAARRQFIRTTLAHRQCFVVTTGDEVAGLVVLRHDFFDQGFIPLVLVGAAHRRQGLALRLLAAAEAKCRTEKLFASTNASNTAAQALLERAGFVRSGVVENLDAQDPEWVYFKPVGRPRAPAAIEQRKARRD